jgi:hypothetical protein
MEKIYLNPLTPGAFSGVSGFSKNTGIKRKTAARSLKSLSTVSLHAPFRKGNRRRVYCPSIDHQWHADLIDLKKLKGEGNGNNQYILTVIDCFSKWGQAVPVRNKCATTVAVSFEQILKNSSRCPSLLQVDQGKEFYGKAFLKMAAEYKIKVFSTYSEIKNSICERWNRTLLERLSRIWTHRNSYKYIDVLPQPKVTNLKYTTICIPLF